MDRENPDFNNPYTEMEGYRVFDAQGEPVGRIEDTVYDEVSDVLKYVIVDGRPIPAEEISPSTRSRNTAPPSSGYSSKSLPPPVTFREA